MTSVDKVTARLPDDIIAVLQTLVDKGEFANLQEVIQEAIRRFVSSEFTSEQISQILMDRQKEDKIKMEVLMGDGSITMDEAVKKAVSEYVRSRMGPGD
jgi:Arc/MetJ-type ribon-helix-helix transcriptional regulator